MMLSSSTMKGWSIHMCISAMVLWYSGSLADQRTTPHGYTMKTGQETFKATGEDSCAMVSQLQHVIIQILSAHYEYGEGIHNLHRMVATLKNDLKDLKMEIKTIDNFHSMLLPESSSNHANASYLISNTLKFMYPLLSNSTGEFGTKYMNFNQVLHSLTTSIESQHKRYRRLQRKVSQIQNLLQLNNPNVGKWDKVPQTYNTQAMDHFMTKQREINGAFLARIQWLEDRLREAQAQRDAPRPVTSPDGCPPNFLRYGLSCYRFENQTANWIDAEKACQGLNTRSHLVSIETREENSFIIMYRKYNAVQWSSYWSWTGGNDMSREGVWTWVGTGKPITYSHWQPGEPSNSNQEQHCIYIRADGDNRWDDWHCYAARLNYICEIML